MSKCHLFQICIVILLGSPLLAQEGTSDLLGVWEGTWTVESWTDFEGNRITEDLPFASTPIKFDLYGEDQSIDDEFGMIWIDGALYGSVGVSAADNEIFHGTAKFVTAPIGVAKFFELELIRDDRIAGDFSGLFCIASPCQNPPQFLSASGPLHVVRTPEPAALSLGGIAILFLASIRQSRSKPQY